LNANCIGCHSGPTPPRGLDWTDVRAQIGVAANECGGTKRINSGSAATSYLVDKIQGAAQDGGCFTGSRMPLLAAPLSAGGHSPLPSWCDACTRPYRAPRARDSSNIASWIDAGPPP